MIKGAQDHLATHSPDDRYGLGGVLVIASGLVAVAALLSLAMPW